jgi:hypothetical protein
MFLSILPGTVCLHQNPPSLRALVLYLQPYFLVDLSYCKMLKHWHRGTLDLGNGLGTQPQAQFLTVQCSTHAGWSSVLSFKLIQEALIV